MNDGVITVEYDDHTEEYGYLSVSSHPDRLTYGVSISPNVNSDSFSAVVPEEKNGRKITAVLVLSAPAGVNDLSDHEHITLKRLYIPSTVRYIYFEPTHRHGADLLNECKVEISPDNPFFCVCKNGIYSKDMTELHYIFSPSEYSDGCFEVPESVIRIKSKAGYSLKGLRRLTVPESVTVIDDHAFEYCQGLEDAVICAKEIRSSAFFNCNSLVSVRLPCCTTIGKMAFIQCRKLEKVEILKAEIIDDDAFGFCGSLKEIHLPDTLRKLGNNAFAASGIKKLTIPPAVQEIGDHILIDDDPANLTLELYLKDGAVPRIRNGIAADVGSLLVVLSPETHEKLLELVVLGNVNKVFTKHGIDFTDYDDMFKKKFNYQGFSIKTGIRAAQIRLQYIDSSDEEKREFFKNYIAEAAWLIALNAIIQYPNKLFDNNIMTDTYLDMIPDDSFLMLIDQSAEMNKPEVTARLLQYQHERKRHE